jgi:type II secretory pathway component GspD/PulD (secretin)
MRLANGIVGFTLGLAFTGSMAWAQSAAAAGTPNSNATPAQANSDTAVARSRLDPNTLPEQTFYFNNAAQPNDVNEIQNAIRNLLPPQVKINFVPSENALMIRGTPDELALTQKLINDLDRPKRSHRLTYTITEMDSGKRVSVQHFSMDAEDGQRVTLKQGSRVPIVTGSSTTKDGPPSTEFQYLDLGMNFDATLTPVAGGAVLKTKVEQSSLAEEKSGVGPEDPVIRQTTIEGTSVLTLGKPLMLGSADVPGSTRHLDVEVVMEEIK